MTKIKFNAFILLVTWTVSLTSGARILALFPYFGKSHFDMYDPYVKELAFRGHQVVVVSHFPQKNSIQNLKDISLVGSVNVDSTNRLDVTKVYGSSGLWKSLKEELVKLVESCNKTLSFHTVQELIHSKEESFDLVIAETFTTDCFIPFAHKFKAPLIGISSCYLPPWSDYRMGNPRNPALIPNYFKSFSDKMSFSERLINTLLEGLLLTVYTWIEHLVTQKYVDENFGENMPPLSELARNTSLILVNTHFSLNRPRSFVPGIIEVGGIHIKPPKKLPKDLEDYLNGAEHGVIYFNMGSMIITETFPDEIRDSFLQAFAELPQRILWKWEGDKLPGQPKNVKISKWFPQFDILNHPKVLVYIGHGGMLGIIEAVYTGVPMLGIPIVGDQPLNIAALEVSKACIRLEFTDINKESILNALKKILTQPSYAENAKRMSRIYQDRPQSAMDTAIYWTEYVIRHKGAPHLRSAALDISWYQCLLLDVIGVIAIFTIIVFTVLFILLRKIISIIKHKNVVNKLKTN